MTQHNKNNNNPIVEMCHPYLFALKEGQKIKQNLLDYSLLLLQKNCTEVVKAPNKKKKLYTFSKK